MSADRWPDEARLDELFEAAGQTKSAALRFDPQVPGGFRVLTPAEDAELIDAIRLPEQRHRDDVEHLGRERETAERVGDQAGAETAAAHLEVLDDEHRRDQRGAMPLTRAQLDGMDVHGFGEEQSRAWEYLDGLCELTDEHARAEQIGDIERACEIEGERRALDAVYLRHLEATPAEVQDVRARTEGRWSPARSAPEAEDEERER